MNKGLYMPVILGGIFLCIFTAGLYANDMILELENGDAVLLHSDHTWDFESQTSQELTEAVSLFLDNGKAVKINTDHTWYFIEKQVESQTDEVEYLGSAYAVGNADHSDLLEAKMKAMSEATVHLSKQILSAIGDRSIRLKKMNQCVEREDKDIETKENMRNNVWHVQVRLSVDSYQIQMIVDCAREAEE